MLSAFRFSFWLPLSVRALVLLFLILGLAGAQLVQTVQDLTVVFVVDHSDSVPQAERKRAEDFIRASLTTMKTGDKAAIVVFGEHPLVERLASAEPTIATLASAPRTSHTNIASALRLALALFPDGTQKRIVLLSDGLENAGRAMELVDIARVRDAVIDVVSLNPPIGQSETYVDALDVPSSVRKGQAFEAVVTIRSTSNTPAVVRLLGDGKLLGARNVRLQAGENRIGFQLTADQVGFHRYTAELQAANDTLLQNNVAAAFTVVHGPPRVLVVDPSTSSGRDGDADNLLAALKAANIEAERIMPNALSGDLTALANYDAVFLVNVPAKALPTAAMNALPSYVRELGRGLVMIGGADAYGAGGYLRTPVEKALPVDMDVRSQKKEANLALVFVIDKSGSMGRCHCDDPRARPEQRIESGLPKIDIAKDAVMQATRAIGRADYLGVVAFDADALWAMKVQPFGDAASVQQQIGGLRAEGGTNIFAGLSMAEAALAQTPARVKHIVLLTDGWSRSGDFEALAQKMQDEGITLSIVAAGSGSAAHLAQLARAGGGRYYPAVTMSEVPALFFKETIEAAGQYLIEEPFYPLPASVTPILRGLDVRQLPALRGYNGATPKSSAQVALLSERGDPVLATWQYGLGRTVAWTSDVKAQWATDWVRWDGFNVFIAQLTNWALPQQSAEGLQIAFGADAEERNYLEVVSRDASGRPRDLLVTRATILGADAGRGEVSLPITLTQVAAGRYRAAWTPNQTGAYLVQVAQHDANGTPVASATTGIVVPYSPEYKILERSASVLPRLAQATGGHELTAAADAFAPLPKLATRATPIWPAWLTIVALLFVCDVAVRRLRLTYEDWQRLMAWLRMPRAQPQRTAAPQALKGLFAARERAQRSRNSPSGLNSPISPSGLNSPISQSDRTSPITPTSPTNAATQPNDQSDQATLERLRKAKERARKGR
jgi:uncharacterized membrane protein